MNKNKRKIVISFLSISLKQLFWVLKGSFEYPQLFWWRNDKITTWVSLGYLSYLELQVINCPYIAVDKGIIEVMIKEQCTLYCAILVSCL